MQRSSVCSDDRASGRNKNLDCCRSDGSAAWIYGTQRDGADGTSGESIFWSGVRIPWAARRFDQNVVVVGRWSLSLFEKTGARKIHLAASDEWNGFSDAEGIDWRRPVRSYDPQMAV